VGGGGGRTGGGRGRGMARTLIAVANYGTELVQVLYSTVLLREARVGG
jgi:hypothetical protein